MNAKAQALYDQYAGRTFTNGKRTLRVFGVQFGPVLRVLVKHRRRQLIPDEMTPGEWVKFVKTAKQR